MVVIFSSFVEIKILFVMAIPLNSRIESFAEKVCKQNTKTSNHWKITDEVFLLIESTPNLLKEYDQLKTTLSRRTVNQQIGLFVKLFYGLENDTSRENHPKSSLIKSHQRFK
jgi:hypothetical protein